MKAGWSTFLSGVVLGGALGFVGGQIAAWTQRPTQPATADSPWNGDVPPPLPSVDPAVSGPHEPADDQTVYFPEATLAQAVRAEAFSGSGDAHSGDASGTASEPATLPGASDALPLNVREDQERLNLRRLIEAEMGHLSQQDREVWEDVLHGLPAEDALGILRMWQRFGQGADGNKPGLPALQSPSGLPPLVPRDNSSKYVWGNQGFPAPRSAHAPDTVRADLKRVRSILVNNLLNADSTGFRRTEPLLADLAVGNAQGTGADESQRPVSSPIVPGVQLIGQRLDLSAGNYERTTGPLDLAIQGDGFFVVREGDQHYYTRCGRFHLNPAKQLALTMGEREFLLDPEIVIPADAFDVNVDSSGNVSAKAPNTNQPVRLGRISLARFLDPTALLPVGSCLMSAGPAAGAMRRAAPGNEGGLVMQAHLESSNVDRARERERLRQLDEVLELLSTSPR